MRPHEYNAEKLALAQAYIDGGWELEGDAVPQIAGLADAIGVCRKTVYNWGQEDDKPEFLHIFQRVLQMQERCLVNDGLRGTFNPAITKMMLTKHGYSDKQEIDHRSGDGSMTPKGRSLDDFYSDDLPPKP